MAGSPIVQAIGPSYHLADRKAAVQRAVNWRLQQVLALGEDKKVILAASEGWTAEIDFAADTRGIFATEDRLFVVAGAELLEIVGGGAVSRGVVGGSGRVQMEDGSQQLVIATGPAGYVFSMTAASVAQITDPDWRGSNSVAELNGTFIFVALDQPDQFYLSAIDDGSDFDALDFSSSDAQPDTLRAVRVSKQEALFFGARSTEVWVYVADEAFPLVRYNATPIDIGIVGPHAVVRAADTLVFVGCTERGTGIVYIMEGHQPRRISTDAVEQALQGSGVDLSQCSLWALQLVGTELVAVNAPGLATTWCWDAATREWHELGELSDGAWTPLRITQVAFFGGQHYGIAGTKLYRLDASVASIDGDPMTFERTWPHLMSPAFEPVSFRELRMQCTTGGDTEGQITLECSNDGGYVFGPPLLRTLGAVGRHMAPVRWNFLGSALDRVFRVRTTGVRVNIHGANLDAG